MVAIYFGFAADGRTEVMNCEIKEHVVRTLAKDIESNKEHLDIGIFGVQLFFEVLAENGLNKLAFEAMNKRSFPSYGHWIEQGATTTWEQWDGGEFSQSPYVWRCFYLVL